jgi:hypothetical protein
MSKFDLYKFFLKTDLLKEADEGEEQPQQMGQQPAPPAETPEQTPQEQGQQQKKAANPQATAFRGLQGQTIAGMTYAPNGTNGGTLKVQVKNSYTPFTISWVNQKVTVTTLTGETVMLSDEI